VLRSPETDSEVNAADGVGVRRAPAIISETLSAAPSIQRRFHARPAPRPATAEARSISVDGSGTAAFAKAKEMVALLPLFQIPLMSMLTECAVNETSLESTPETKDVARLTPTISPAELSRDPKVVMGFNVTEDREGD